MTAQELEMLLNDATPAMDGLKRIRADDWSVDGPCDFTWSFIGRENDSPRVIVIERGMGRSADARQEAIERLCILASTLARREIAAEKLRDALREAMIWDGEDAEGVEAFWFAQAIEAMAAWEATR